MPPYEPRKASILSYMARHLRTLMLYVCLNRVSASFELKLDVRVYGRHDPTGMLHRVAFEIGFFQLDVVVRDDARGADASFVGREKATGAGLVAHSVHQVVGRCLH